MRQPSRARALLAVSLAVLLPGPTMARAQTGAERDATMSSVQVPGGLPAAFAALNEKPTADPSALLLDLIRRSFETPVGTRGLRREATLRPLLDHLSRAQKSLVRPQAVDVLPLPLTPDVWTSAIFGGRVTPETLLSELLRSPSASLLYCGLLALDPPTRRWFAANPALLTEIAERHAGTFLLAAPGLHIENGAVRVPGGSAAVPVWQALAGRAPSNPTEFIRALLTIEEGRLAYFYGTAGQLGQPERQVLLSLDVADPAARTAAARRMLAIFHRIAMGWDQEERPFWRPALDPALLLSDLPRNRDGVPHLPGTAGFWAAVFGDADPDRDRNGLTEGPPVEFTWLCEQIFTGGQAVVRAPYQQVLFVSRRGPLTRDTARDAVIAARAATQYPTLVTALERARIGAYATYAAAVRRAAALAGIDDERRAAVAIAQFQGAIAFTARARARGSLDDRQADVLIAELAAVETDARGEYGGGIVQWLMGAVAAARPAPIRPAIDDGGTSPIEPTLADEVFWMLAGPPAAPADVVEWEGTRYRVDFAVAEAVRLRHLLGDAPAPYLAAAGSLVTAAGVIEAPDLTRAALSRQADLVSAAIEPIACERRGPWTSDDLSVRCREALSALTRAGRSGDVKNAARLAPRLRLLADTLAARGLTELTYAVALGQPDSAAILAADAASRHEFGFHLPGFGRLGPWKRPAAGADRVRDWHVTGSLLGLETVLAPFGMMRLSARPPATRPTLNDEDRRVFMETVTLMDPWRLTPADNQALIAALRGGRERLAALRSDGDGVSVATALNLSPTRRSLLSWALAHESDASRLSPYELLRLGVEPDEADRFDAWGVHGEPRIGCFCLQMPSGRQADLLAGRWHTGVLATGFPDLNVRLAEMLAELKMPATLLPSVLAAATWDFVINVRSRDYDDRQGMVEFVDGLTRDRVEQYLALLTTDGPLVPIGPGSGSN